jgi:chemotaxis protein MotA
MAYCFIGPMASKVQTVVQEDSHFNQLIREVLIANLHRHPPNICIEVGRQNTPHHVRPSFSAVEEVLRNLKQDNAA